MHLVRPNGPTLGIRSQTGSSIPETYRSCWCRTACLTDTPRVRHPAELQRPAGPPSEPLRLGQGRRASHLPPNNANRLPFGFGFDPPLRPDHPPSGTPLQRQPHMAEPESATSGDTPSGTSPSDATSVHQRACMSALPPLTSTFSATPNPTRTTPRMWRNPPFRTTTFGQVAHLAVYSGECPPW